MRFPATPALASLRIASPSGLFWRRSARGTCLTKPECLKVMVAWRRSYEDIPPARLIAISSICFSSLLSFCRCLASWPMHSIIHFSCLGVHLGRAPAPFGGNTAPSGPAASSAACTASKFASILLDIIFTRHSSRSRDTFLPFPAAPAPRNSTALPTETASACPRPAPPLEEALRASTERPIFIESSPSPGEPAPPRPHTLAQTHILSSAACSGQHAVRACTASASSRSLWIRSPKNASMSSRLLSSCSHTVCSVPSGAIMRMRRHPLAK
mmetsp:Transcript_26381/g.84523  ORF Transcript_26381/g.84523 Transcript_26381/m.84523 type:complete len:270 (+) Transcript_26381:605-1414(+)